MILSRRPGSPGGASGAAADITVTDTADYFTGTDVEAVLQEIGSSLAAGSGISALLADPIVVGAGGQANVQFSSIPQTHRNLRCCMYAGSEGAGNNYTVSMQLNGDTGDHYSWTDTGGGGSGATHPAQLGEIVGGAGGAGSLSYLDLSLPEYSSASHKHIWRAEYGYLTWGITSGWGLRKIGYEPSPLAAITDILLTNAGGDWCAGSVFCLIGEIPL